MYFFFWQEIFFIQHITYLCYLKFIHHCLRNLHKEELYLLLLDKILFITTEICTSEIYLFEKLKWNDEENDLAWTI